MSNLTVTNVNSIADADRVSGQAKAWANLNGLGTIALRDSLNVSGVTDQGTGIYLFSYTNAFANINYVANTNAATQGNYDAAGAVGAAERNPTVLVGTTQVKTYGIGGAAGIADGEQVDLSVLGDLA